MLKNLLLLTMLFCFSIVFAQDDFEQSLDSLQTLDDVNLFFKKNKKVKGKVIVFNEEKHKTRMATEIMDMSVGAKKYDKDNPQRTYYKVIEKNEIPYYKVSCIYLDGSKHSIKDINIIRNQIILKYKDGHDFSNLAKQYSMDSSAKRGGDLGWFTHGDLHPDFERPIIEGNYGVDDVFKIDLPELNAYYVVVMTQDRKLIKESKVLKVTMPRK